MRGGGAGYFLYISDDHCVSVIFKIKISFLIIIIIMPKLRHKKKVAVNKENRLLVVMMLGKSLSMTLYAVPPSLHGLLLFNQI